MSKPLFLHKWTDLNFIQHRIIRGGFGSTHFPYRCCKSDGIVLSPNLSECYYWYSTYGDLSVMFSLFDKVIAIPHKSWHGQVLFDEHGRWDTPEKSNLWRFELFSPSVEDQSVYCCTLSQGWDFYNNCALLFGGVRLKLKLRVGLLCSLTGLYCRFVVWCTGLTSKFFLQLNLTWILFTDDGLQPWLIGMA